MYNVHNVIQETFTIYIKHLKTVKKLHNLKYYGYQDSQLTNKIKFETGLKTRGLRNAPFKLSIKIQMLRRKVERFASKEHLVRLRQNFQKNDN